MSNLLSGNFHLMRLSTVSDIANQASQHLDVMTVEYFRGGAMEEQTLNDNEDAFSRYRIVPHFIGVDVHKRDLSTTVMGTKVDFPIGIAPYAFQSLAHKHAERGTMVAAAMLNTLAVLSTLSTVSMEKVAKSLPPNLRWFQLYMFHHKDVTERLIRRAEESGYSAIVVTVDTPYLGKRLFKSRMNFLPPSDMRFGNFDEEYLKDFSPYNKTLNDFASAYFVKKFTPDVFHWLKAVTRLPIVVKGILSAHDARLAVRFGASAIWVSNHGARQMDGVPATIDVLEEIVAAVGRQAEVYLDGGVRTGADVLKALALGARFVFVGRPTLWGLAFNGTEGVANVLGILRDELDLSMALTGHKNVRSLNPGILRKEIRYISDIRYCGAPSPYFGF